MKNQDSGKFEIKLVKTLSPEQKKFFVVAPAVIGLGILIIYFSLYADSDAASVENNKDGIDLELPNAKTKELSNDKQVVFDDFENYNKARNKEDNFDDVIGDPLGKRGLEENNKANENDQLMTVKKQLQELENKKKTASTRPRTVSRSSGSSKPVKKELTENEKILLEIERRNKLSEQAREANLNNSKNFDVKEEIEKVKIKAYVYRDQKVLPFYNVNLRLITPFTYKGKYYESGYSLYGTVDRVSNNRVFISVTAVGDLEIKLTAHDPRRKHEGLYFLQAGKLEEELKEEVQDQGIDVAVTGSKSDFARAVASILKSNKKKKLTHIPLYNDYEMELRNY